MTVTGSMRAARKAAGLSQTELAHLAGVPQSTVGRIEAGLTTPRADTWIRLLAVCGWTVDPHPVARHAPGATRSHTATGVPSFMWDSGMTWERFRASLRSPDPDVRGWAYSRLLGEAHWSDIWSEVTPAQVAANLPLTHFRERDVWERFVNAHA